MAAAKVERLLTLLQVLLDAPSPLTAEQVRARVPGYSSDKVAFRRALERDKAELADLLGHPVRAEPIPGTDPPQEGYRLRPDEAYLRDPGLTTEERRALAVAASAVRLAGIDPGRVTSKVGATDAGPLGAAGSPGALRTELPADDAVISLFQAVADRREARFRYRDEDRRVRPRRLRFARGRWYLDAFDLGRDAERLFRLDRIDGAVTTGAAAAFPPGPAGGDDRTGSGDRLDEPWALGDGPAEAVRVWFAPGRADAARRAAPRAGVEVGDDGSVVLTFAVRMVPALRSFVLGFDDEAEVLGPPPVRADVVAWLTAIAEREAT